MQLITRLVLLCVLVLSACSRPEPDDYFPLNAGLRWTYQVSIVQPHRVENRTWVVENLEQVSLKDQNLTIRRTSDGTDYYIAHKADGFYRTAKRSLVELNPQFDTPERLILPLSLAQAKGKAWSSISMPYLIQRLYEGLGNLYAKDLRFPMTYSVLSVDEQVDVPAGHFEHCVLVEGQAELVLYTDPRKGESTVQITTREWYAPSVGLVKLEREEPLNTDVYKGGTVIFELVELDS